MKKTLTVILTLILLVCSSTNGVYGNDNESVMEELAARYISISTEENNGNELTVYRNIDQFIEEIHLAHPEITDHEIACFIVEYSNQDMVVETQEDISFILGLNNIHVLTEYYDERTAEKVDLTRATWNSSDGYMKIETYFSYQGNYQVGDKYLVWATATWKKMPIMQMQDVFALGSSATYDDSYSDYGVAYTKSLCLESSCGNTSSYYMNVNESSTVNLTTYLLYSSGYPYLKFTPVSYCSTCYSTNTKLTHYTVMLRYRVIANSTEMIYAGYSHKTFGVSGISVSIPVSGYPAFSIAFGSTKVDYCASGVTLTH